MHPYSRHFEVLPFCAWSKAIVLQDDTLSPRRRLLGYFAHMAARMKEDEFCGCLIGTFTLESAVTSKATQLRLSMIFVAWGQAFVGCIVAAQAVGEVDTTNTAGDLAVFPCLGSLLRGQADKAQAATAVSQSMMAEISLTPIHISHGMWVIESRNKN